MRLKRVSLLFVFIFSIMMTNLFYSHSKPPLLEYKNNHNIIILADNNNSNPQEIIALDFSTNDNGNFIVDYYKDMIPEFIGVISTVVLFYLVKEKFFKYREVRGLTGIILWDRNRVLRN